MPVVTRSQSAKMSSAKMSSNPKPLSEQYADITNTTVNMQLDREKEFNAKIKEFVAKFGSSGTIRPHEMYMVTDIYNYILTNKDIVRRPKYITFAKAVYKQATQFMLDAKYWVMGPDVSFKFVIAASKCRKEFKDA